MIWKLFYVKKFPKPFIIHIFASNVKSMELEEIIVRSTDLFHKFGIKAVTMDRIAKELKISKKSLYKEFPNKEKMISTVLYYSIDRNSEKGKEIIADAVDAIEELLLVLIFVRSNMREISAQFVVDLPKYNPDIYEGITRYELNLRYDFFVANLRRGISEGYYRDTIDIENIANLQCRTIFNPKLMNFRGTLDKLFTLDMFKTYLEYHIYGIATERGRDLIDKRLENLNE